MDKQQLKERETRVIELATAFCKEHLDDECAELCTKLLLSDKNRDLINAVV